MKSSDEIVDLLREWTEVFMHRSMSGFVCFAKDHGLSMSQVGALFHLSHRGICGVSDIAESLGVTSAAASQMLDRLVQQKFIIRSEDPNDRRSKQITLTQEGRAFLHGISEARRRWYRMISEGIGPEERQSVAEGLKTLIDRTSRTDPDVVPKEQAKHETTRTIR